MSKVQDNRRISAALIKVVRENLVYLLAQAQRRSDPNPQEIETLELVIEYVDKCAADATVRNHDIEELLISLSRLRQQRDDAIHDSQYRERLMVQLQAELDSYRAQYPNPAHKPPVRPHPEPPPSPEYFPLPLPFMENPKHSSDTSSKS